MRTERLFDLAERAILIVFGASFLARFAPQLTPDQPHLWILAGLEVLVILFVIARPLNAPISTRPKDFILALAGTSLPLFVSPVGAKPENASLAGAIMLAGVILSVSGKVALNRRFGMVAANRGVQVKGPFRIVRHPIYAGYAITHVGFLVANPYWWNALVYALALGLQISRIVVEEETLRLDEAYQHYAERVRFRLVPGLY